MRVLVTGATGFVGKHLSEVLHEAGHQVRAAVRVPRLKMPWIAEQSVVGEIGLNSRWTEAVEGVDAVVHLAARVHVMNDSGAYESVYDDVNAYGTRALAQACAAAGVRRFVFLSSVKVNGEGTAPGESYSSADVPAPADAYGRSKWRGEQYLAAVGSATGMETVVVRAPLVYGAGVRANFLRLMRWVDKELPLPFGCIDNRRSLVSVANLCDLLLNVLTNSAAAGGTWLVSDGHDLSTPELVQRLARQMGRKTRLLAVPTRLLKALGAATGKSAEVDRLCGSLALNISDTRTRLGWAPPQTVETGLADAVSWYLREGPR